MKHSRAERELLGIKATMRDLLSEQTIIIGSMQEEMVSCGQEATYQSCTRCPICLGRGGGASTGVGPIQCVSEFRRLSREIISSKLDLI
jgi:hypothetical protein